MEQGNGQTREELERRIRERTAELEAKNRELEAFAYSVSHDLRAPLRYVTGFVEMLRDHLGESLDAEGKRILDTVVSSAAEMGELIERLLAYSRSGRTALRQAPVELNSLIDQARELLEPKGTKIEWQIDALPAVCGDEQLLQQVMTNLISNAIKFSRTRPCPVIRIIRNGCAEGVVEFSVADNGVGFDMAHAGELFGVFKRMHLASEFEGHGVGLANARRIVERHGGSIGASAAPDEGATFTVRLPAVC
ncbi:MAG: sensor histidine kinase [Spirochaetota bacterium]